MSYESTGCRAEADRDHARPPGLPCTARTGSNAGDDGLSVEAHVHFGAAWDGCGSPPHPERTRAGLAAARARGRKGGRPSKMTPDKIKVAKQMLATGEYTMAEIAAVLGVSRASIYRALGEDATVRGRRRP